MPDPIINLLIQIPLVGIFIWFILERDKRSDAQQKERDQQWREFLKEQREQNNAAVSRLAEEQKEMRSEFAKLAGVIEHLMTQAQGNRKNRNT
jgi:Tfp pilus assembly protein PilO